MYFMSHSQQPSIPRIDLTRLKDLSEDDWATFVIHVPFLDNPLGDYLDYTDNSNLGRGSWVFRPKVHQSAKQAGLTMLRTLNFLNK